MAHFNSFLNETRRRERVQFKEAIIANRAAQLDANHYTNFMRQLSAETKPRTQGQRGGHVPMTYEEQVKLEQQRHVKFNELSAQEQAQLAAERESLWSQIPAHIQAKSRKLAGR
jgi:hypothetical protein